MFHSGVETDRVYIADYLLTTACSAWNRDTLN